MPTWPRRRPPPLPPPASAHAAALSVGIRVIPADLFRPRRFRRQLVDLLAGPLRRISLIPKIRAESLQRTPLRQTPGNARAGGDHQDPAPRDRPTGRKTRAGGRKILVELTHRDSPIY